MSTTPRSLVGPLLATAVLVTAALLWLGWRLLVQEDALEQQRVREQTEAAADAIASGMRGQLAEAGESLSAWVAAPDAAPPSVRNGAAVRIAAGVVVSPAGALPFVPATGIPDERFSVFTPIEALEFAGGDLAAVVGRYRQLARDSEPRVRAGALLRLGRVLRRTRDYSGARDAYEALARLGAVRSDDLPAELVGLDGQRVALQSLGDREGATRIAATLLDGLDNGRWLITRGTASFYRDALTTDRPPGQWRLANAATDGWQAAHGRLSARGRAARRMAPRRSPSSSS